MQDTAAMSLAKFQIQCAKLNKWCIYKCETKKQRGDMPGHTSMISVYSMLSEHASMRNVILNRWNSQCPISKKIGVISTLY